MKNNIIILICLILITDLTAYCQTVDDVTLRHGTSTDGFEVNLLELPNKRKKLTISNEEIITKYTVAEKDLPASKNEYPCLERRNIREYIRNELIDYLQDILTTRRINISYSELMKMERAELKARAYRLLNSLLTTSNVTMNSNEILKISSAAKILFDDINDFIMRIDIHDSEISTRKNEIYTKTKKLKSIIEEEEIKSGLI